MTRPLLDAQPLFKRLGMLLVDLDDDEWIEVRDAVMELMEHAYVRGRAAAMERNEP